MENSIEKLNFILNEINSIKDSSRYIKKAKKFKSDSYSNQINKLDSVTLEQVKKHSFVSEVYRYAEHLEKQRFVSIFKIPLVLFKTFSDQETIESFLKTISSSFLHFVYIGCEIG